MSSHTQTTITYFCDLCGRKMPRGQLTKLYMDRPGYSGISCNHADRDVCSECLSHPISELTEAFRRLFSA